MTEFAKKTGDYASLSATDIKVIALTYQLEKEKVGTDHLKSAPKIPNTVDASVKKPDDLTNVPIGFYLSQKTVMKNIIPILRLTTIVLANTTKYCTNENIT